MANESISPEQLEFLRRIGAVELLPEESPPLTTQPVSPVVEGNTQEDFLRQIGATELIPVARPNNIQRVQQGQLPETFDPITYNQGVAVLNEQIAEQQRLEQQRREEEARLKAQEQSNAIDPTLYDLAEEENTPQGEDLNENNFLDMLLQIDPSFKERWDNSSYYNKKKYLTEEIEKRTVGMDKKERERIKNKILSDNKEYLDTGYFDKGYIKGGLQLVGDTLLSGLQIISSIGTLGEVGVQIPLKRQDEWLGKGLKAIGVPEEYTPDVSGKYLEYTKKLGDWITGEESNNLLTTRLTDWLGENKSDVAKEIAQANAEAFDDSSNVVGGSVNTLENIITHPSFVVTEIAPSLVGITSGAGLAKFGVKKLLPTVSRVATSNNTVKRKVAEAVDSSLKFVDRNAVYLVGGSMSAGDTAQGIDRAVEGDLPLELTLLSSLAVGSVFPAMAKLTGGYTVGGRLDSVFSAFSKNGANEAIKKGASQLVNAPASLKTKIAKGITDIAKTAGSEGLEEGLENYIQTLIITGYDKNGNFSTRNMNFEEAKKQGALGASIGALTGAMVGTALLPIKINREGARENTTSEDYSYAPSEDNNFNYSENIGIEDASFQEAPNTNNTSYLQDETRLLPNFEEDTSSRTTYEYNEDSLTTRGLKSLLDEGSDNPVEYKDIYTLTKYVSPSQIASLSKEEIAQLNTWINNKEVSNVPKKGNLRDIADNIELFFLDGEKETNYLLGSLSELKDSYLTLSKLNSLATDYRKTASRDKDINLDNENTADYIQNYSSLLNNKIATAVNEIKARQFSFSSANEKESLIQNILEAKEESLAKINELKNSDDNIENNTLFEMNETLQGIYDSILPSIVDAPIEENGSAFTPSLRELEVTSKNVPKNIVNENASKLRDYNDYLIYLGDKINSSSGEVQRSYITTYRDIVNKRNNVIKDTNNLKSSDFSLLVTPRVFSKNNTSPKITDATPEVAQALVNNTSSEIQYILSNLYPRSAKVHTRINKNLEKELETLSPAERNKKIMSLNDTISNLSQFKKKRDIDLSIRDNLLDEDTIIAFSKSIKATQNIKLASLNEITKKRINNILQKYAIQEYSFVPLEVSPFSSDVLSFSSQGKDYLVLNNKAKNKFYEAEILYRAIYNGYPIILKGTIYPTAKLSTYFRDLPLLKKSMQSKTGVKKQLADFLTSVGARVDSSLILNRALKGNDEFSGRVYDDEEVKEALLNMSLTKEDESNLTLQAKNKLVSDKIMSPDIRSLFQSYYDNNNNKNTFSETAYKKKAKKKTKTSSNPKSFTIEDIYEGINNIEQGVEGARLRTMYIVDKEGKNNIGKAIEYSKGSIEVFFPDGENIKLSSWEEFFKFSKKENLNVSPIGSGEMDTIFNLSPHATTLSPIARHLDKVLNTLLPKGETTELIKSFTLDLLGFFNTGILNNYEGIKNLLDQANISEAYLSFVNTQVQEKNILNPKKAELDIFSYAGTKEALKVTIDKFKKKYKKRITDIEDYLLWREEQSFAKQILRDNAISFTEDNFELIFNRNINLFENGLSGLHFNGELDLGGFKYQEYFNSLDDNIKSGYKAIEEIYNSYANAVYELLNLKGILSGEELEYVKTRGFWLSTRNSSSSSKGSIFKSGRKSRPDHPLETSIRVLDRQIISAYKNEALLNVLKEVMGVSGNRDIVINPLSVRFNPRSQSIEVQKYSKKHLDKKRGEELFEIYAGGKAYYILSRDKKLNAVFKQNDVKALIALGRLTQNLAIFKTILSIPNSTIIYPARDAIVSSASVVSAGNGKVISNEHGLRGLKNMYIGGASFLINYILNKKNFLENPMYQYYILNDLGVSAKSRYADESIYEALRERKKFTPNILERIFESFSKIADPFEQMFRYGIFYASLKEHFNTEKFKTYSDVEEAINSLDPEIKENLIASTRKITIDYTQRGAGTITNWFRALIMFFNSIVQGGATVGRALLTKYGIGTIATLMTFQFLRALFEEEDEYLTEKNISANNKFKVTNTFGIPMDLSLGVLTVKIPMYLASMVRGKMNVLDVAKNSLADLYDEFSPFQRSQTDNLLLDTLHMITPSLLTPILLATQNKNFFGGAIAPSYMYDESTGKKVTDIPDYLKYTSQDGDTAKGTAAALYKAFDLDVSPSTLSHFAKSYFGEVYNFVTFVDSPVQYLGQQYDKIFTAKQYSDTYSQVRDADTLYKKLNGHYMQYGGAEIASIINEYKALKKQRDKSLRENKKTLDEYKIKIAQDKSTGTNTESLTKVVELFYNEINQPLGEWYEKYKDYPLQQ